MPERRQFTARHNGFGHISLSCPTVQVRIRSESRSSMTDSTANTRGFPRSFFWNIAGSVVLGFSWMVLLSNLTGIIGTTMRNLAGDEHIWEILSDSILPIYGVVLMVVFGTVAVTVGWRVLSRKVMGYPQLVLVLAAGAMPIVLGYLM